jgi:hypothetical protein
MEFLQSLVNDVCHNDFPFHYPRILKNLNYTKLTEHYVIKFSEYFYYLISSKTQIPNENQITQQINKENNMTL